MEVECTYVHQTDRGLLIKVGNKEIWLPKSQIHVQEGDFIEGNKLIVNVPDWLVADKGLE